MTGPSLHEVACLAAPPHWRAVDLLSDLHLCEALPRTTQAFIEHLESTDADAVLILGDLFEVWIGDDQRLRPFEHSVTKALQAASRRRWLGFMPGNRDFLVGTDLCAAAGLSLLNDPTCLQAFGASWLLTHGDALCLEDAAYQDFRRTVRGSAWQSEFRAQPFDQRWALAQRIRSESRTRKAGAPDPALWADVDRAEGLNWMTQAGASTLIHGHTHRPCEETWGNGTRRVVLSDWDLDNGAPRAEVLRLDAQGLSRRAPACPAAR